LNNAVTNENGGNVEYIGCTFTGMYYIATYSVKSAKFTNCIFDREDSRAVLVYSHGDNPCVVTLEGCTFKAKAKGFTGASAWTAAVEIDTTNIPSEGTTVTITNCTADENYSGIVRDKSAAGKANAVIVVDGLTYVSEGVWKDANGNYVVSSADGLTVALADNNVKNIILGEGEFGTIVAKSNKTITGTEKAKVNAVNLNGAENLTLKNIKFDAATAVMAYGGNNAQRYLATIFSRDASNATTVHGAKNLLIEGCKFTGTFPGDGGVVTCFADQTKTGSHNVTIKDCTFDVQNCGYAIYGYYFGSNLGNFVIEVNTFKSATIANTIYMGKYASSNTVVVKNNTFEAVDTWNMAYYLQKHSDTYIMSTEAENNTGANGVKFN
jgi:hypothetical protein